MPVLVQGAEFGVSGLEEATLRPFASNSHNKILTGSEHYLAESACSKGSAELFFSFLSKDGSPFTIISCCSSIGESWI
jgi:hypothetical protein